MWTVLLYSCERGKSKCLGVEGRNVSQGREGQSLGSFAESSLWKKHTACVWAISGELLPQKKTLGLDG